MNTITAEDSSKALVTRGDQTLANIPEHLKARLGDRTGSEDVGRDDVLIPRLSIAQEGMSPQLKRHNENFIPGLEPGQLFNSVTGEIYGESATVVPLFFFKNFIEFVPMNQGGGVTAMYNDIREVAPEKLKFGKDGTTGATIPPVVTEFKNRMCLLVREGQKPLPIVVSFKSSGLKAAKTWNSLIMSTNLPAFARAYTLKVTQKIKGQQSWYVLGVAPGEFVPEEFFNGAQKYFDQLKTDGFKVDTTGIEAEAKSDEDIPF